jgi:valyl-tRNA synthetase
MNDTPKFTVGGKYVGSWTYRNNTQPLRFLQSSYETARAVAEKAIEQKAALAKDPNLTDVGRQAKAREWAENEVTKEASQAVRAIRNARAEMKRKMEAAKPLQIDRTDAAAAVVRSELRQALKTMPAEERSALLAGAMANPEKHPELVAAVVEAPIVLSGVAQATRDTLVEKSLEAANPGLRETLEELTAAIETTERALKVAGAQIAETAGMSAAEVLSLIESAAGQPQELAVAGTLPTGEKIYYGGLPNADRIAEISADMDRLIADMKGKAA